MEYKTREQFTVKGEGRKNCIRKGERGKSEGGRKEACHTPQMYLGDCKPLREDSHIARLQSRGHQAKRGAQEPLPLPSRPGRMSVEGEGSLRNAGDSGRTHTLVVELSRRQWIKIEP